LQGRADVRSALGGAGADSDLSFLGPAFRTGAIGRLGQYDILAVVGRGGMGVVLKAFDEVLQRIVAIKVLAPALAASATARKRFIREAQTAAAVTHDHVITIHAVDQDHRLPFLVMQFIAGISLEDKLASSGPLEVEEILRIGLQTAAGLAAAHAHGLIHRDIKPANILLENGIQRVKITDFGLARVADAEVLTQSGVIAGTPQYMAPEQARGEPLDQRADLFSLGSVLYAMCTGQPPFRASTNMAVLRRVCEETSRPIRELNPCIPDELIAVIHRLHSKDVAGRFQSASEVADILGKQLARLQQTDVAALRPALPQAPPRRHKLRWLAALLDVALVAAGAAWYLGTGRAVREHVQDPGASDPAAGEATTPPVVICKGHTATISEVVFSPDNETVASAGVDKIIYLWNTRTGAAREMLRGHEDQIRALAFAPDGKTLASATEAGDVRLWDVAKARQTALFKGHKGRVLALGFSPDGQTLATGGWDRTIRLWDVASQRERALTEEEPVGFIRRLVFTPDGKTLISAGNQITFWDVKTRARRGSVGFGSTSALLVAPTRHALIAASWKAGVIALLDLANGNQRALWQTPPSDLEGLALSPDGKALVSVGEDGMVRVWDPDGPRLRAQWPAHNGRICGASFSPDGKTLATGGADDLQVKLWNVSRFPEGGSAPLPDPLVLAPIKAILKGHTAAVPSLAFSPDGQTLASASADKTVRLWDVRTAKMRRILGGSQYPVQAVAFSSDNKTLASAGGDDADGQELKLWDTVSGQSTGDLSGHTKKVYDVAFSTDGKLLASGGADQTLRVWDVMTRQKLQSLDDQATGFIRRVAFTPNGKSVLSGGDLLTFWDVQSGALQRSIEHRETTDMKISPAGDLLAAGGWNSGKITLFEMGTGRQRVAWQAHRRWLHSLAFSPDGRFLASTSADGTAMLWEVAGQRLRAVLLGHAGSVYGVAFAPDGRTLATSGENDHNVLLWDIADLVQDSARP
jgi:WD40 repeat protein